MERFLIVDGGALQNLFAAGGTAALDLLFKSGQRVVVPKDVLTELGREVGDNLAGRMAVLDWIANEKASGARLVVPNFEFPGGATDDLGDDAIRALMKSDTAEARAAIAAIAPGGAEFRLLTDDGAFFRQLKSGDARNFTKAGLRATGMYEQPYYGSFEFLNERFVNKDISIGQYESFRDAFKESLRYGSLSANSVSDFQGQILKDRSALEAFDERAAKRILESLPSGHIILKGGVVGLAGFFAHKFGLLGDILSFGITAAEAAELHDNGDVKGANNLWARYIFETAGGVAGGAIGAVLNKVVLKGFGGALGGVLSSVGGGVLGSMAGAEIGDYLYKNHPELFDPQLADIYAYADQLRELGRSPIEATGEAFLKKLGFDLTAVEGSSSSDWMLATDWGARRGNAGDDILLGWKPDYRDAGASIDPADPQSEHATQELRMMLDGGAGNDWVIALGGKGAITIGGEGKDFIFNTSYKGQLYGDTIDGTGARSTDVFWWSPSTFIMDAGPEDILQFYGLPLTGGTNAIAGLPTGQTKLAFDWVLPFVSYGYSESGQLLVFSALDSIINSVGNPNWKNQVLDRAMVIENYRFGEGGDWAHSARGDLGMTFRISRRASAGENGMNLFFSVWGQLISQLDALKDFGKMLKWVSADDPLVLDLDGDGIETTSVSQGGVHFDFNGDHFAELSGWVGADDGFLVLDRDGNGRIDDISELFGAPGGSGFAELRAVDDNADGKIDSSDVAFSRLQVWRDLNQDGISQAGELFSLADLGITSINAVGDALNVTSPSGALLREKASFTRADGSTGDIFEAIFETDPIDTVFAGDRGTAGWAARGANGAVIDDKGFGLLADLSVALSNDIALNDVVKSVAAAMTTPDLAVLRRQVELRHSLRRAA